MKSYRADEHYRVHRAGRDGMGDITHLSCMFCPDNACYATYIAHFPRGNSKSGAGRYARARSAMVKHIASVHPGMATEAHEDGPVVTVVDLTCDCGRVHTGEELERSGGSCPAR